MIDVYCVLEILILFRHMLLPLPWLADTYIHLYATKKLNFLHNVKIKVCVTNVTLSGSSNPNAKLNLDLNLLVFILIVFILIFTSGFLKKRSKLYKPLSDD